MDFGPLSVALEELKSATEIFKSALEAEDARRIEEESASAALASAVNYRNSADSAADEALVRVIEEARKLGIGV